MSNEYKEWLQDRIGDIILERGLADKITNITVPIVDGVKNGQPVRYEVGFDMEQYEWKIEHKETDR